MDDLENGTNSLSDRREEETPFSDTFRVSVFLRKCLRIRDLGEPSDTNFGCTFPCCPGPNRARFETPSVELAKLCVGFPRSRATEVPEKLQPGRHRQREVLRVHGRDHARSGTH